MTTAVRKWRESLPTRAFVIAALAMAAAAVAVLGLADRAQAYPVGCNVGTQGWNVAWAQCSDDGTTFNPPYHVRTYCDGTLPWQSDHWLNGPSVYANHYSYAECGDLTWRATNITKIIDTGSCSYASSIAPADPVKATVAGVTSGREASVIPFSVIC